MEHAEYASRFSAESVSLISEVDVLAVVSIRSREEDCEREASGKDRRNTVYRTVRPEDDERVCRWQYGVPLQRSVVK